MMGLGTDHGPVASVMEFGSALKAWSNVENPSIRLVSLRLVDIY